MDKAGNAVSMMISSGHMSAPVVPGTGFAIAHFGICGWTDPRHPNAIAPGKRLRLSGPAMAIRPGEMVMPIGTPGSDVIAQAIAQVLINIEVFGMDVQLAVEQPRFASYSFPALFFPHGFVPGQVKVEESLAARIGSDLEGLGHRLEVWPERHWRSASMCLIRRDLRTGLMSGAADPRRDAYALGW
jgi:gamma-glutamyltranspeptidase/glutathione hydrolase